MDLIDFQEDWKKIVAKGLHDYNSLTTPERVWFNVESLIILVCNGGLVGYYCNSGADHVYETMQDLQTIGKKDVADLLEKMNALFPDCDIANDPDERNEIISDWDEELDQVLEDLDDEFFEKKDDLEKTLAEYILLNNLASRQSSPTH